MTASRVAWSSRALGRSCAGAILSLALGFIAGCADDGGLTIELEDRDGNPPIDVVRWRPCPEGDWQPEHIIPAGMICWTVTDEPAQPYNTVCGSPDEEGRLCLQGGPDQGTCREHQPGMQCTDGIRELECSEPIYSLLAPGEVIQPGESVTWSLPEGCYDVTARFSDIDSALRIDVVPGESFVWVL